MSIHPNSVEALREERPNLSKRQAMILRDIESRGPGTDREIRERMQFGDMNAVRPRVSELIASGHLRQIENVRCHVTGKTVRRVGLTDHAA